MSKEIRLTVVIEDEQVKKDFKLICAIKGVSMKERVEELIKKDIDLSKGKLEGLR